MLAFAWPWDRNANDKHPWLSRRLAGSLCSGIGGRAATAEIQGLHFAYRPLRPNAALAWRPAALPSGRLVAFHGYFDNAAALAAELGASPDNLARLYGLAVERWGEDADRRVIGEYCAIIAEPEKYHVRLSRSPLRAPPLVYFQDEHLLAVASVPRAIFATGVEQRLNEARVADSALINFTNSEASWFEEVARLPLGHTVELQRGTQRRLRKYYDLLSMPDVRMKSDADCIARANELLDEGVRVCLAGFSKPGAMLSGGLDSPQVAVRTLAQLPPDQRLPTFTFVPEEGYDGRVQFGMVGDERPYVEAFAAMHPRLDPHFTANEGYEHDYRWNDFFHLMGGAPNGLCNMYVFHGLFAGAAKEGCDLLLMSEWGNYTFSDKGSWGLVEYFLTGRWRQLWLAHARFPGERRRIIYRFFAHTILPLLPDRLWLLAQRIAFPKAQLALDSFQPLSDEYRETSGANERQRKQAGFIFDRYQPWNRRHSQKLLFHNLDCESDEMYQAFELMYGVPQRDPMAYRPFVEFCFGLPVEMFLRDGVNRWMAKEMARGIMPEKQRENRLNGRWDADWHLRIGRRRKDFLAEIERLEKDERLAYMLDLPRMRSALENWPDQTEIDPQKYRAAEFAVPRGLLTARFINYVEGRNV